MFHERQLMELKHRGKKLKKKKKWSWVDREGRTSSGKKFLTVGKACVVIFWPTPGFKGRTFVSCEFWVHSTPLQEASSITAGQALTSSVFRVLPRVVCTLNSCWVSTLDKQTNKQKSISKLDIKQSLHLNSPPCFLLDLFCWLGKHKHLQSNVSCKQVAGDHCLCEN